MSITIRRLTAEDWRLFSEIRLRALRSDPQVFGSNYESESQFSEADWRRRLGDGDCAVFGIFADDAPVGMTGAAIDREDSLGKTAIFWGSWLEPDFRGKGLSELMYRARIEWAKAQPAIERIIVSHRASNLASKYANQKHGFVQTHTKTKIWTDGASEDEVIYERYI